MKIRSIALALLATAACRSSSSNNAGPDAPNTTGPDGMSDDTSIYDIQDPGVPPKVAVGQVVNVRGVVVTAIDSFGTKTGDLWVEEPAGGNYSGVLVYGADVSQIASLQVGDLVDIVGASKAEFALSTDTSGRTTTGFEPPKGGAMTVTKTGTGTVPPAVVVDALMIGQMAAQADQDTEWRKTMGVLITVNNVGVISSTKTFGSSPGPDSDEFTVTGNLVVESTLAAFPTDTVNAMMVGPQYGDCEMSITGLGDYFFDWLIEPRATADIVTSGTGCPQPETGALCHDGIDNDGNGHADCADYSCDLDPTVSPSCNLAAKVHDIDTSATNAPVGGSVILSGACVVAVDSAKQNLWIADAGQAASDGGVYVFRGSKATTTTIVAGNLVNIDTTVILPYHGLMEFDGIPGATGASPNITLATGACVPLPVSAPLATLADATKILPYVGSLTTVTATKLTVTAVTGTGTAKRYTLSDGTSNISMSGQIYDPNIAAANTNCYSAVTAIATLDTTPDPSVSMLLPRSAADLVPVSCN